MFLELDCHGYGPKPGWMDKGVLEREQALKVKRIISQTKSRKRQRQLPRTPAHLPSTVEGTSMMQGGASPLHQPQFHISERDINTSHEESWSGSFYDTTLQTAFFGSQRGTPLLKQRMSDVATDISNAYTESTSRLFESSERVSALMPAASGVHESNGRSCLEVCRENGDLETNVEVLVSSSERKSSSFYGDSYLSRESIFSKQVGSSSFLQTNCSSTSGAMRHHTSWPVTVNESISRGYIEDTLFMYYLDKVFYIQYPFYHSSNHQGKGWLFSIHRRVKSAYYAALALSEYHQLSTLPQQSGHCLSHLRENCRNYDLALREMRCNLAQSHTWGKALSLFRAVETLTCILQLLFWEIRLLYPNFAFYADISTPKIFNGGKENWQMHLGAAAALVPALAEAWMASLTQGSIISRHGDKLQYDRILYSEDASGIKILLGSFISFDIISCASTRSRHFLPLDHKLMLEQVDIHLENFTGCRNWAMIFIFEISLLDRWKKEAEEAGRLSIVELTRRGCDIEERLRERLADAETNPSMRVFRTPSALIYETTKIFALSAMTYLHVVMSGACPELPEIRESVSETVDALQGLTDPKLLRSLVWPFCISGCLALDGQQGIFRSLVSAAQITKSTVGTCLEALKIMEECWEIRKSSPCNFDWVSIMNKRGHYVLLG